jgi:biopolymer transport protein ExbD
MLQKPRMARIYRRSLSAGHSTMPEISLTPLIDTALVLLVIFMVTTPMMHNALKLTLPKGHTNDTTDTVQQNTPVTVSITNTGTLFVQDQQVTQDTLVAVLRQKLGDSTSGSSVPVSVPVYVYGDENISYAAFMQVIDSIKYGAGVDDVVLATGKA